MLVAIPRISADQRLRAHEVAHADPGADRLGERGCVDHHVALVEREHRRQRLAGEADVHVRVVLEHGEAVLGAELQQPPALLERQRAAAGVVEVGDDVRELRPRAALERPRQRLDVEAVGLQRDREQLRAEVAKRQQRAVVARRLDHHHVAGLDQALEQEGVRLHRAVGCDHLLGRDTVLLRDPGHQRRVSRRGPVRDHRRGVLGEGAVGGGAQLVDGHDVERGRAPREGDVLKLGRHPRVGYPAPMAVAVTIDQAREVLSRLDRTSRALLHLSVGRGLHDDEIAVGHTRRRLRGRSGAWTRCSSASPASSPSTAARRATSCAPPCRTCLQDAWQEALHP